MFSLYNIWAVARIEVKTLFRSWFFRIFSMISLGFLGFWAFAILSPVTGLPWMMRGIPSTVPYIIILFLNSVQAVIAVFLASDFLKRDKKLDTTEVVYMRSMTNGDYVLGKSAGILSIFLGLNFVVLLITLVMHLILGDTEIMWGAYLVYPLIISLPTLVFILGLSFLMMILVRNQAITFVIVLGYIATTLFYLSRKAHYLFDYMSYNVPMLYSDFTGFSDLYHILMHRGIYLLLGLSFISITIFMIKRLPQSNMMTSLSRAAAVLFLAAALLLSFLYLDDIRSGAALRRQITALGDAMIGQPVATPGSCSIELDHLGEKIRASASLAVVNNTDLPLEKYIFRLNPGLVVESVTSRTGGLEFSRNIHILEITPPEPLLPSAKDTFTVKYSGTIDEEACYADIPEEDREKIAHVEGVGFLSLGKKYSFMTAEYLLLTPETLWYPAAGPGFSPAHPEIYRKDFIDFSLDISTLPGLTAISQGAVLNRGQDRFSFRPESPIPSMTLVIGEYETRSITVDSTDFHLAVKKGHDFFSEHFSEIGDTLSVMIGGFLQETENKLGLDYQFKRLSLVEVPIHFHSYRHLWSVSQETVQPEIVLLPEKGLPFRSADFRRIDRRRKRHRERDNQTVSDIENQADDLTRFVTSTLTENSGFSSFRDNENPFAFSPSYNIFPNFLTFTSDLKSTRWPILNMALEAYYAGKLEGPSPPFVRFITGLSPDERISLALEEKNLQEIMADKEERDLAHFAIRSKGNYLFLLLESTFGKDDFNDFLSALINKNRFGSITGSQLVERLKERFGYDFAPQIDDWFENRQLPGFLIGNFDSYKVLDGDRERYQVKIRISNPEPVSGLLKITFRRSSGRGQGGFFSRRMQPTENDDELEKFIAMNAAETKEFGFILDYQPERMEINTLISKNIPSIITMNFDDFELKKKAVPFDGERTGVDMVVLAEPGEIIVDDEDPGFKFDATVKKSLLKRMLPDIGPSDEEKYVGMVYWRSSGKWLATTDSKFYGRYIRSAHFAKIGKGKKKASWNAELKENGYYDIYVYISRITPPWHRHSETTEYGSNSFLIHHDDGVEDTRLELNGAEDGWNFLGSYYISGGTATVEISDKSDKGRFVIADAVKWVKR
ncbi:MAG: hypothetical protein JW746_07000 [Candidatus Krumholzibacteriota bacterium]|nr:hypothetical protein [Candidatus Krumholzibacteriota bacterium]